MLHKISPRVSPRRAKGWRAAPIRTISQTLTHSAAPSKRMPLMESISTTHVCGCAERAGCERIWSEDLVMVRSFRHTVANPFRDIPGLNDPATC